MKNKKYTYTDIIDYVGKEKIEQFSNNVYNKMLPLISKVAKPKLHIIWEFSNNDPDSYNCGTYAFPCVIKLYPLSCANVITKDLEDIELSTKLMCHTILFVLVHELSHTTQDTNLLEIYDGFCKNENSYRQIVEDDNNSRTFDYLEEYADFIKDEFGIDVNESFNLECNRCFYVLDDITKTRFISMIIESFLMRDFESDNEIGKVSSYIINLDNALLDDNIVNISLTINNKNIILKSIENGICKYISPDEITDWLLKNNFNSVSDKDRHISSFNSSEKNIDGTGNTYIDISVKLEQ